MGETPNKFKKGEIVVPNIGPHKGIKHNIIHVDPSGNMYNIQPIGLNPKNIKYRLGAVSAKQNQLQKAVQEDMKKTLKESKEEKSSSIDQLHAVVNPYKDCKLSDMVKVVNPKHGIAPHKLAEDQIHGMYGSKEEAQKIAEQLFNEHSQKLLELEEKKTAVSGKISKTIDSLEKKRKEWVDLVKEDPKNASSYREKIAHCAHQIDDLMGKLSKIEKSKKEPINKKPSSEKLIKKEK